VNDFSGDEPAPEVDVFASDERPEGVDSSRDGAPFEINELFEDDGAGPSSDAAPDESEKTPPSEDAADR
jgi:hypothetical protein